MASGRREQLIEPTRVGFSAVRNHQAVCDHGVGFNCDILCWT